MTLLQFLCLYMLPLLVCLVVFLLAIREDGYLRLSELGKMAVFTLVPIVNIFTCAWIAAIGLTLLGARLDWDRMVWVRKRRQD